MVRNFPGAPVGRNVSSITLVGMSAAPLELVYAPYRLLFKRPFGTAHGLRDGTDCVFVRLRRGGFAGYGEATLPPYLSETLSSVIQGFKNHDLKLELNGIKGAKTWRPNVGSMATRAALSMAYYDLITKEKGISFSTEYLGLRGIRNEALAMVTLGLTELADVQAALSELPATEVLKVKLSGVGDVHYVKEVLRFDGRKLFVDANQGWETVEHALAVVDVIGDRLVGIEQPFRKDRWDLHGELQRRTSVPVYGDESIQGPEDLERSAGIFGGVNIKLMKCGGLDVAAEMAVRARELGMRVMLGCMSESSLGCGAMAQLSPLADVVDLDGPWLLANDPFEGLVLDEGRLRCTGTSGFGVRPVQGWDPGWIPIVA